jgi:alkylation response protein AidB-like acyl-CoA dehydrogenase
VDIRPIASLDPSRRLAEITFMNAAVEPLGEADIAAPDRARKAIAAALAAESVGVASFALDSAVAYAKEREQFGRPIGAYQAVSHVCAQMYRDVENARSAVLYAAWTVDHAPTDAPLAIAMATSCALEVGYTAPEAALQIFGGIGFSWEHHLHLWLKRGRSNAALGGGSRAARARVAELIGVARLREA